MSKDRHGICDGCDRQKPLVLVRGRGLCINCQVLWKEAQKAMLDEVISEHESQLRFLKEEGEVAAYTYGFIEAHIEYLKQKYGVSDE